MPDAYTAFPVKPPPPEFVVRAVELVCPVPAEPVEPVPAAPVVPLIFTVWVTFVETPCEVTVVPLALHVTLCVCPFAILWLPEKLCVCDGPECVWLGPLCVCPSIVWVCAGAE